MKVAVDDAVAVVAVVAVVAMELLLLLLLLMSFQVPCTTLGGAVAVAVVVAVVAAVVAAAVVAAVLEVVDFGRLMPLQLLQLQTERQLLQQRCARPQWGDLDCCCFRRSRCCYF